MQKQIKKMIPILMSLLCVNISVGQEVEVSLQVSGNTITVFYTPDQDFNTAPNNMWGSQVFTIRYPASDNVTFSNFSSLSPLNLTEDSGTAGSGVDGGDGFIYKKFSNDGSLYTANLTNGIPISVISIDVSFASSFELITGNAWTTANNGDLAVFNIGAGGNIGTLCNCLDVELSVFLEGAFVNSQGQMTTELNTGRQILPGQTPVNPLVSPTPAGNPYRGAPWNYTGTIAEETYAGPYSNVDQLHVTDWLLISFRSSPSKQDEFKQANGLLYSDGHVEFIQSCVLDCTSPPEGWVVIEHRNHMGVMSDTAVIIQNGALIYDFRQINSFRTPTSFGQKQVMPGLYTMYGGDGDQQSDFPSYDINGLDILLWSAENGNFDQYRNSDYNLNGDANGADKIIWSNNNGISSAVPKN